MSTTVTPAAMAKLKDYNLCISFTRSGIDNRVPWVLVLYRQNSKKGVRLRVKAVDEETSNAATATTTTTVTKNTVKPGDEPPKYAFLARENAYVENYRCWGRVNLSEMVDGFRDCQKWVIECLGSLSFIQGEVNLWDGLKAKNIWEIESTIDDLGVRYFDLSFVRGPAYVDKDTAIRMGFGGPDEDENAKGIAQAELDRLQQLLENNTASQVSFLAKFSIEHSRLAEGGVALLENHPQSDQARQLVEGVIKVMGDTHKIFAAHCGATYYQCLRADLRDRIESHFPSSP
ncbi:uncharacterized protein PAC_10285 [Phialocephala subalpina]|uniref:Uncharacterized protein n=1 Tax=Phialocephala subalpina TaxID=576137 RepID=A0A1L7X5U1_9HELO|nr:uncharacterized protein PAC_10285 [Phialocephala subalpina]